MEDKRYIYAVTRVHNKELNLLSGEDISKLCKAPDLKDCIALLKSKGWDDTVQSDTDINGMLKAETDKTWSLVKELTGSISAFDIFKYKHDFNNLKAAVKLAYSGLGDTDTSRYFTPYGTADPALIMEAAKTGDFSVLPAPLDEAGKAARQSLSHTGSGQYSDIIIDRAMSETVYKLGMETKSGLIREYVTLAADIANIKTAVRGSRMKKTDSFFQLSIADCGSLSKPLLTEAAVTGEEAVYDYLSRTKYRLAAGKLRASMPEFEAWCGNKLIELIRPQRHAIEGLDPIAAFILARENEISMAKLILSSKINNFDAAQIRQRVRDMYV